MWNFSKKIMVISYENLLSQVGSVDQLLLDWQVIVSEPLVISYPVTHVYVTVSPYLIPVLVVADEFAFCTTGVFPQLISTTRMSTNNGST